MPLITRGNIYEHIFRAGLNANFESVSAEMAGKGSRWLNLLMSRLPLIRNHLIQIHTLMVLQTQRAYCMGGTHASLSLSPSTIHIVDLQVLVRTEGT